MKGSQYKIGAVLSYLTLFISNIVGLIYTPILLRSLGQEEYGLYSLVGSMIATLSLVDLGVGNASIRYISKYRALGDKEKEYTINGMFIMINSAICIVTLIMGFILYQYLGSIFSQSLSLIEVERFKIMFLILVFNLAIGFPFSVFGSIIVSYEQFVFPKVVGLIRTILNPIVIVLILFMGYKALAIVIANTIINVLFLWVNVYYCLKKLKVQVLFKKIDFVLLKEITIYSLFIFLAIIVDKIYWTTDQFILGVYSGTTAVAIYAIASQFNMYYMQFSTAISGMFLPRVTAIVTKESDERALTELFIKVGRIQYIIIGLILTGFMLFGQEFIILWAGSEYIDSYIITLILITPFTIPLIQNMGITILQAKNMHSFRSIVYFFIALANLVISIPLAKIYGGIGCAAGTAVSMVIGNILIINIYYYKKIKIDIPLFWKEIMRMSIPIGVCFGLGIVINKLVGPGVLLLPIKIGIYTICYSFIMFFGGMNKFEKELILSTVRIITNRLNGKAKISF